MQFKTLDAMRGAAALAVALYHSAFLAGARPAALENAALMVDFFFVLSGFVMAHAYRDRIAAGLGFGRFALMRLGRLFPLHAVLMLAWVPLVWYRIDLSPFDSGQEMRHTPETFLSGFFLLNSIGLHDFLSWNYTAWSIGAELVAYAVFFVAVAALGPRLTPALALAVSLAAYVGLASVGDGTLRATHDFGALRCLGGFFLGVAVYGYHGRIGAGWRPGTGSELALAGLIAVLLSRPAGSIAVEQATFFSFGIAVLVFARSGGVLTRALAHPGPAFLGRISYSVYMVHALVFAVLFEVGVAVFDLPQLIQPSLVDTPKLILVTPHAALINLAALALVVAISALSFRFIEEPGRKMARRLADRGAVLPAVLRG